MTATYRIEGHPLAIAADGAFLVAFDDAAKPEDLETYMHGLLWVARADDGRIRWTEGVRKMRGTRNDPDVNGLWPDYAACMKATLAAVMEGKKLPRMVEAWWEGGIR